MSARKRPLVQTVTQVFRMSPNLVSVQVSVELPKRSIFSSCSLIYFIYKYMSTFNHVSSCKDFPVLSLLQPSPACPWICPQSCPPWYDPQSSPPPAETLPPSSRLFQRERPLSSRPPATRDRQNPPNRLSSLTWWTASSFRKDWNHSRYFTHTHYRTTYHAGTFWSSHDYG